MLITVQRCVDWVVVGVFTTTNMCYCISPALASLMLRAPHSSEQHAVASEGIPPQLLFGGVIRGRAKGRTLFTAALLLLYCCFTAVLLL